MQYAIIPTLFLMCHYSFYFLPPLPKQTTTYSILQQSIGLRFYFHCDFEQVMGITTGVNNTFHASRFSRKLYFIGAELRFVRSAQALPRARPVGGLDTLSVGTASNTQQHDTEGSLRLNSPGEKLATDSPPSVFFFRSKLTDIQKSALLLSLSRNKGHSAREKRHATQ